MKKLVVIAVLFAVMAGGVYAQGMGVTGWSSPQSTATQGRIRSAADDFIRPDSYTSARVNDWFGMTSFASTSSVSLGYAKQMEKLYIAAYYGGTFWANVTPFDYTETKVDGKTYQAYGSLVFTSPKPNNRVAVLIGVADMGFRFSFFSDHESFSGSNVQTGAINYKSYAMDVGSLRPQLAWSMTKNLAENGIKPYVTVDLDFQRDYQKTETTAGGMGEYIGHSNNIVQPIVQVGLGGFNLHSKDAFRLSADLEYRLTLNIYDNEYSYTDGGKYKTGKISGLNPGSGSYTENSSVSNLITPYLAAQWGGGPVALRARLQLPVSLGSRETAAVSLNNNKMQKNGADTTTTTIGFNPAIQLALQWRPISKLALNVGGSIGMGAISNVTTETTSYSGGTKQGSTSKSVASTFGSTSNQLTIGATFNPTDYLTFEAASGVGSNNNIDVFSTTSSSGGLFNFANLLVSLKF